MRYRMLILCGLCTLSTALAANIYRCEGLEGTTFQDRPCSAAATVVSDHGFRGGSGLRASERDWLLERSRHKPRKSRVTKARVRDDKAQQRRCWTRRTRLEKVRAHLRRGYKPAQGERLRRQRKNDEDYLSRFCG